MIWEWIYQLLTGYLNSVGWRVMTPETVNLWNLLYFTLGGFDNCTRDLDAVNQAQYVILRLLDIIAVGLGIGDTPGPDPCQLWPE